MTQQLNELFQKPVEYVVLPESGEFHSYYYFKIGENGYRVNISRLATKTKLSYIMVLNSMSPSGKTMQQFKYVQTDIVSVLSTVYAIFAEWMSIHKNTFAAIAIRLPDKIADAHVKFARRLILKGKKNYPKVEEIPLTGIENAANKYIFLQNSGKPLDDIIKSLMYKGFSEYDFKGAFPADLLDSIMMKTAAQKSHLLPNLSVLSKNFDDDDVEDIVALMFKNLTPAQVKFTEKTEAAIQFMDKPAEEVVTVDDPKVTKQIPTTKNIEFWWSSPIGNSARILILNEMLDRVIKMDGNINSLTRFLVAKEDDNKPYDRVSVFEEVCKANFPKWDNSNVNLSELSDSMRNCFMAIEVDYLKWLDFWNENGSTYVNWTPYIFYAIKKKSIKKGFGVEAEDINFALKQFIVGFYVALSNNFSTGNIGAFKYAGVNTAMFPAMYEYWDIVRFAKSLGIASDVAEEIESVPGNEIIETSDYYTTGKIEKTFDDIMEHEESITLAYIPLDDLEEPVPVNSIFSPKNAKFLEKKLEEIQKKKCQPKQVPQVQSYTGSGFTTINGSLRNKALMNVNKDVLLKFIKEMDDYGVVLSSDIEVSRKTSTPASLELNKVYIEPGASSTSISSKVWSGTCMMKIRIPAGSKVFFAVGEFSGNPGEKEIILPPGAIIKPYRKIQKKQSKQVWYECMYMGSIMSYLKDMIEGKIQKKSKEDMFDLDMEDNSSEMDESFLIEEIDSDLNKTNDDNFDRSKAIMEEELFQGSDELFKLIKSGKISPDWVFKKKKSPR